MYPVPVNSVSPISSEIVTFKTSAIFNNVSSDGNDLPVTILLTATFEMPTFSASKADVTFLADIISFNCKFIKFALIDYFCKYRYSLSDKVI